MYKKNHFMTASVAAAAALSISPLTAAPKKPNVVLILSDDQGYSDLRLFQKMYTPENKCDVLSPNMDYIGTNGLVFSDFYVHPVCTPTRYSLLTGNHIGRSRDIRDLYVINQRHGNKGMRTNEYTMAEMFKDNGYNTSILGKWHLGHGGMLKKGKPPYGVQDKKFHPLVHGFDYFYGFLGGSIDYNTKEMRGQYYDWWENRDILWKDDGKGNNIHPSHNKYATYLITDKALEKIDEYSKQDNPFFMYLSYPSPHWAQTKEQTSEKVHQLPVEEDDPKSPFYRKYLKQFDDKFPKSEDKTNIRKRLLAMVKLLDDEIGRVLKRIKKDGLEKNTIIVFLSDNGGEKNYPDYTSGWPPKKFVDYGSDNSPFRGEKGEIYEGGVRVPAMILWPGKIKPGVSHQIAAGMDLKQTLATLTGCKLAPEKKGDGIDLTPNIKNPGKIINRDLFYSSKRFGDFYRQGNWKYLKPAKGKPELYNLEKDITEKNNLANKEKAKLAELKKLHRGKKKEVWK